MHKHLPAILLGIEIVLLLLLLTTGPLIPSNPLLLFAALLALLMVGWGGYALQRNSIFSFFPHLPNNASLVVSGPYEIIRHPMYSGLLLFALVTVMNFATPFRITLLVLLTLTIIYKMHREEEYLEKKFGEYQHYRRKTKRLIPYLY